MAPEFRRFAEIGATLMKLHIDYEQQAEYPLQRTETGKLNLARGEDDALKDKTQLRYNEFLTLSGIPAEMYCTVWATGARWNGWWTSTGYRPMRGRGSNRSESRGRSGIYCSADGAGGYGLDGDGEAGEGVGWVGRSIRLRARLAPRTRLPPFLVACLPAPLKSCPFKDGRAFSVARAAWLSRRGSQLLTVRIGVFQP